MTSDEAPQQAANTPRVGSQQELDVELDRIAANVRFLKAHGHLRMKRFGADGPYTPVPLDIT